MPALKSQGKKVAKAYIGIGSNLGNRLLNIQKSVNLLKKHARIIKKSPIYSTEPVGFRNQGWFLNCVIKISTDLAPMKLLVLLKGIEKKLKRKKAIRNGPRTIDLDILFYDDKIIKSSSLTIPHPRMHKRLFVLEPLSKISHGLLHPLKKTAREIKEKLKSKDKVKLFRKNF